MPLNEITDGCLQHIFRRCCEKAAAKAAKDPFMVSALALPNTTESYLLAELPTPGFIYQTASSMDGQTSFVLTAYAPATDLNKRLAEAATLNEFYMMLQAEDCGRG